MAISPAGLGNTNDCAEEAKQQFARPTIFLAMRTSDLSLTKEACESHSRTMNSDLATS
jgi:hypothetical protein